MFSLTNLLGKRTSAKASTLAKKAPLHLEALEDRSVPAVLGVSYGGGAVIPNVQIETVYYGRAWTNAADSNNGELTMQMKDYNHFLSDLVSSNYLTGLDQYAQIDWHGGWLPLVVKPGKGQNLRSDTVDAAFKANAVVTDGSLQTMLQNEIVAKHLDRPDANKLYIIVMPPGVKSDLDYNTATGKNTTGGGYHQAFKMNGVSVHYAIIENGLSGFTGQGSLDDTNSILYRKGIAETSFSKMTEVTSHEVMEAITDPDPFSGWLSTYTDLAGKNKTTSELGDASQANEPASGIMALLDGYMVQKYWSARDKAMIAPGAVNYAALPLVPYDLSGHFTLNGVVGGKAATAEFQFDTVSRSAKPTDATFNGRFKDASGKVTDVIGNLQVSGRSMTLTVRRQSDGATLFTGVVESPNGDFNTGAEIVGTDPLGNQFAGGQDSGSLWKIIWGGGDTKGPVSVPSLPGQGKPVPSTH